MEEYTDYTRMLYIHKASVHKHKENYLTWQDKKKGKFVSSSSAKLAADVVDICITHYENTNYFTFWYRIKEEVYPGFTGLIHLPEIYTTMEETKEAALGILQLLFFKRRQILLNKVDAINNAMANL